MNQEKDEAKVEGKRGPGRPRKPKSPLWLGWFDKRLTTQKVDSGKGRLKRLLETIREVNRVANQEVLFPALANHLLTPRQRNEGRHYLASGRREPLGKGVWPLLSCLGDRYNIPDDREWAKWRWVEADLKEEGIATILPADLALLPEAAASVNFSQNFNMLEQFAIVRFRLQPIFLGIESGREQPPYDGSGTAPPTIIARGPGGRLVDKELGISEQINAVTQDLMRLSDEDGKRMKRYLTGNWKHVRVSPPVRLLAATTWEWWEKATLVEAINGLKLELDSESSQPIKLGAELGKDVALGSMAHLRRCLSREGRVEEIEYYNWLLEELEGSNLQAVLVPTLEGTCFACSPLALNMFYNSLMARLCGGNRVEEAAFRGVAIKSVGSQGSEAPVMGIAQPLAQHPLIEALDPSQAQDALIEALDPSQAQQDALREALDPSQASHGFTGVRRPPLHRKRSRRGAEGPPKRSKTHEGAGLTGVRRPPVRSKANEGAGGVHCLAMQPQERIDERALAQARFAEPALSQAGSFLGLPRWAPARATMLTGQSLAYYWGHTLNLSALRSLNTSALDGYAGLKAFRLAIETQSQLFDNRLMATLGSFWDEAVKKRSFPEGFMGTLVNWVEGADIPIDGKEEGTMKERPEPAHELNLQLIRLGISTPSSWARSTCELEARLSGALGQPVQRNGLGVALHGGLRPPSNAEGGGGPLRPLPPRWPRVAFEPLRGLPVGSPASAPGSGNPSEPGRATSHPSGSSSHATFDAGAQNLIQMIKELRTFWINEAGGVVPLLSDKSPDPRASDGNWRKTFTLYVKQVSACSVREALKTFAEQVEI